MRKEPQCTTLCCREWMRLVDGSLDSSSGKNTTRESACEKLYCLSYVHSAASSTCTSTAKPRNGRPIQQALYKYLSADNYLHIVVPFLAGSCMRCAMALLTATLPLARKDKKFSSSGLRSQQAQRNP